MAEPPDETEGAETGDAIYECALAEVLAEGIAVNVLSGSHGSTGRGDKTAGRACYSINTTTFAMYSERDSLQSP